MTPNGDNEEARAEVEKRLQAVAQQHSIDISLDSLVKHIPPFEQAADSELVTLAESLTGHTASAVAFATEAPFLQQLGMETIVMGPGSIDRAHQPDEYMELEQMRALRRPAAVTLSSATAFRICAILPLGIAAPLGTLSSP